MRESKDKLRKCPTCGQEAPDLGLRDYSTWAFDALPGRMGGSDIDRVVERHGNFLAWEFKPNKYVPTGQRIMFDALATQLNWVVYVAIDKDAADDRYQVGRWVAGRGVVMWWTMTHQELAELEVMWVEEQNYYHS